MQLTTDDLTDYGHRFSGHLVDALVKKGIFTSAEIAQMHRDISNTANGPRAAAIQHIAADFIKANGG